MNRSPAGATNIHTLAKRVDQVRMHVAGANRGGDHVGALIVEAARHGCNADAAAFATAALRVIHPARAALDAMIAELLSLLGDPGEGNPTPREVPR